MLDPAELQETASAFGVDEAQVVRDHLISHLLAAISAEAEGTVLFFGGTALARTVLPDGRLSEDIDLIALGNRSEIATRLTTALPRALHREFPGLAWEPSLSEVRDSAPAILRATDGTMVRIQLLSATGYPRWPSAEKDLIQRYTDAPPARLIVPTTAAFAAAKASAWRDRRASRDLWDLWAFTQRASSTRRPPTSTPASAQRTADPTLPTTTSLPTNPAGSETSPARHD